MYGKNLVKRDRKSRPKQLWNYCIVFFYFKTVCRTVILIIQPQKCQIWSLITGKVRKIGEMSFFRVRLRQLYLVYLYFNREQRVINKTQVICSILIKTVIRLSFRLFMVPCYVMKVMKFIINLLISKYLSTFFTLYICFHYQFLFFYT